MRSWNVLLVTGGSSITDTVRLDPVEIRAEFRTRHYQYRTVGAMLLDALHNISGPFPKVFQSHFEDVFTYIKTYSHVDFKFKEKLGVVANLG
jgi:hypothetical protein